MTFQTVGQSASPQLAAPILQKCGMWYSRPIARGDRTTVKAIAQVMANVIRAAGTGSNAVQYEAHTATQAVPAATPQVSDCV